jgi:hypothetical protein
MPKATSTPRHIRPSSSRGISGAPVLAGNLHLRWLPGVEHVQLVCVLPEADDAAAETVVAARGEAVVIGVGVVWLGPLPQAVRDRPQLATGRMQAGREDVPRIGVGLLVAEQPVGFIEGFPKELAHGGNLLRGLLARVPPCPMLRRLGQNDLSTASYLRKPLASGRGQLQEVEPEATERHERAGYEEGVYLRTKAAGSPADTGESKVFDDLAERHAIDGSAVMSFGALGRGEYHRIGDGLKPAQFVPLAA